MSQESRDRIERQAKEKMQAWTNKEKRDGNNITNNERIFMRSRFQHKALVDEIVRGKRRTREEQENQENKEHLPTKHKESHQGEQEDIKDVPYGKQITSATHLATGTNEVGLGGSNIPQVLGKVDNKDKASVQDNRGNSNKVQGNNKGQLAFIQRPDSPKQINSSNH